MRFESPLPDYHDLDPAQKRLIHAHNDLAAISADGWDMIRLEDLPHQLESIASAIEQVALDYGVPAYLLDGPADDDQE